MEIGAHKWDEGARLGHEGAVTYLTEFLSGQREENRLIAVGIG
jgi:acetate kinase